jgi:hypothetical protein
VQKYVEQYIIYIKDKEPFTTKPSVVFTRRANDLYELVETINGNASATIIIKDNFVRMVNSFDNSPLNITNENYYLSDGKYRFEIKPIDPFNGFNIRKAYWIYKLL